MKFLSFKDGLRLLFSESAAHAEMIPEGYSQYDVVLAGFASCRYVHNCQEILINSFFASATLGLNEDKSKDEAIKIAVLEMLSFNKQLYWAVSINGGEIVLCEKRVPEVFEGDSYTGGLIIDRQGRFVITFDQPQDSRGRIDNGVVSHWLNSLIFR